MHYDTIVFNIGGVICLDPQRPEKAFTYPIPSSAVPALSHLVPPCPVAVHLSYSCPALVLLVSSLASALHLLAVTEGTNALMMLIMLHPGDHLLLDHFILFIQFKGWN